MAVKPFTPIWLERLVRRCLEKDPDERYQSMRDVVLDLRTLPVENVAAPVKAMISLRLPADVIERWRSSGPGWQTRMAQRLARAPVPRAKAER